MADHLSTAKKIEHWLTKPIAAGLISYGISMAAGEGDYFMNLGPIGVRSLPMANGIITAGCTFVTDPIGQFLMPMLLKSNFTISNAVFLPVIAGATNWAASRYLTGDSYNGGMIPIVCGVAGEIGGQYLEDNILMKL